MCAVATSAAILGGAALLGGGLQAIDGAKRAKRANAELNAYERQSLDNAFKDIQLSTEGIDLMRDENARASGNLVDAASNAGSRTIIGAAPRISSATNSLNAEAAANLDKQNINRAYAIAGDNARIEGITEGRDIANISALSSQANAGRQDMWSGIMGAASGLGAIGRGMTPGTSERTTDNTALNLNPAGGTYSNMPTGTVLPSYPAANFNPNAANYPATPDAPAYNSPYFDFRNPFNAY